MLLGWAFGKLKKPRGLEPLFQTPPHLEGGLLMQSANGAPFLYLPTATTAAASRVRHVCNFAVILWTSLDGCCS